MSASEGTPLSLGLSRVCAKCDKKPENDRIRAKKACKLHPIHIRFAASVAFQTAVVNYKLCSFVNDVQRFLYMFSVEHTMIVYAIEFK